MIDTVLLPFDGDGQGGAHPDCLLIVYRYTRVPVLVPFDGHGVPEREREIETR